MRFEWDPVKSDRNVALRRIAFSDVIPVFLDPDSMEFHDEGHSDDEDRWVIVGRPDLTRPTVVMVIYTERLPDIIRIISARRLTRDELRAYRARHAGDR